MEIRIFIVDDHQLFIDGLQAILSRVEGFSVVGTANSGKECIEKLQTIEIDLLITDISMPEMRGEELVEHLVRIYPSIKILTLSMHDEYSYIDKMLKAGVLGYIHKNASASELRQAVETVAKGENFFTSIVSDSIAKGYAQGSKKPNSFVTTSLNDIFLTKREKGILKLVFKGMNSQNIADETMLSYHTITQHRKNINAKLGTNNRQEIEAIVKKKKLLD
ncbi:MAG: response regulator transcription factor [Bacteroidales bacterium]|nr:response regulator transcription factor [Bacteroidales bacterium]